MPTINNRLNRTARGLARLIDVGIVVCLGLGFAWLAIGPFDTIMAGIVGLCGFLTATTAFILIHTIGVRCPQCREGLHWYYKIALFQFTDLRRCPKCRLDLDGPDISTGE